MHTPAAALAWELWHKHRVRLMSIIGTVLGFALVYPKLWALAGFHPNSPDALQEIGSKFAPVLDKGPSPLRVVQILYIMFLANGPLLMMFLTLLYVTWMFTFTESDPKTKNAMTFAARVFTLPVSTSFLFWWLWLAGMATVAALYGSWTYFVPLPRMEIFGAYQTCFGWMTLLALAQGVVWALPAWPLTRMLALITVVLGFLCSPAWRKVFEAPLVLPSFFLVGSLLARVGLQKMRHGQWQGWHWQWPFPAISGRAELRGPKRFASPAQAQLWFEWRRFARGLCFAAAGLALVPVAIHLLVRFVAGLGPIQDGTMLAFVLCLTAIPLSLHFFAAVTLPQTDLPFLMLRPLTNGGMMMATLKAAAISTAVSSVVVWAALYAMPLLGNFHAVEQQIFSSFPQCRTLVVLGLMLLTWRLTAVSLCFVWSGKRWLAGVPAWPVVTAYFGAMILAVVVNNGVDWHSLCELLACLLAAKFLLAFVAFRVSLKRGLLAPSALVGYLVVWMLLAAALLIPTVMLFHDREWMVAAILGIVLLTPLARVGFCPITLAWNRHA